MRLSLLALLIVGGADSVARHLGLLVGAELVSFVLILARLVARVEMAAVVLLLLVECEVVSADAVAVADEAEDEDEEEDDEGDELEEDELTGAGWAAVGADEVDGAAFLFEPVGEDGVEEVDDEEEAVE